MIIIKKVKLFIFLIFLCLIIYFIFFRIKNNDYYSDLYQSRINQIVEVGNPQRGKIYDTNGNVLVDNKKINNLVFVYNKSINLLETSYLIEDNFSFPLGDDKAIITWYKAKYNSNKLLSDKEKRLLNERKISADEKEEIISKKILEMSFADKEKRQAYVFDKLVSGYLYEPKVLIYNVDDEIINKVTMLNIEGIKIDTSYERYYPYGDTLKNLFGSVGKITKETKDDYLSKGYSLSDEVGISYLENYYENYLKGKKAKYLVNSDYSLTKMEDEQKGNDLYLSIDINLQQEIEKIVEENMIIAKKRASTKFFNDTYVIMSNPNTGSIIAIVGKRILSNEEFNDIVINNITSAFTPGSIVKGASISVGYKYNLIDNSVPILDSCVKLHNKTEKCSFERLGYLDSVVALEKSSNYYQFILAIKALGLDYKYDMDLNVTKEDFDRYREMFASYGLGIKTGIDLPNEQIGLIGNTVADDLYLNLAIGQYDTYTPIEIMTYINTIASYGQRRMPSLVKKVKNNQNESIYQNTFDVVQNVDIKKEDFDLIHEGFYNVMQKGTGLGYFHNDLIKAAGKTGTSESFLDSDNDGKIDTSTITLTMGAFFPYDNPRYSMVIVAPHISYANNENDEIYYITARISRNITDFMFENNKTS